MAENQTEINREQINSYVQELPVYEKCAEVIQVILERAAREYAPLAIVQTRPKSLSSFSEKISRRARAYKDPVHQVTDLCGARVIALTLSEVDRLGEFIRQNFDIDQPNSVDAQTRLGAGEFGYRSVHYVVQLRRGEILGVTIPEELAGRKAEIQVRTFLQHAWAELTHDRVYKNEVNIPEDWRRQAARLMALIENADTAFDQFAGGLDSYVSDYGAYMCGEQMGNEIELLTTVFDNERDKEIRLALAMRIAMIARAAGKRNTVIDTLKPFACTKNPDVLRELGNALCQGNRMRPKCPAFSRGQKYLEEAMERNPEDAQAVALLARSWELAKSHYGEVRRLYRKAFEIDPTNPRRLASFVEHELASEKSASLLQPLAPALHSAIRTCREYADMGIELPWAFFAMGKFYLFLEQPYESLAAYAKGLDLSHGLDEHIQDEILTSQLRSLRRLSPVADKLPGHEWICRLLLVGKSAKPRHKTGPAELRRLARGHFERSRPVIILAGLCAGLSRGDTASYRKGLKEAFADFDGVLVSGGTTAGVSGLAGSLAQLKGRGFEVVGYRPRRLPKGAKRDTRYDGFVTTDSNDFSPLDPLQMWIDLAASGVDPSKVRLLGIGGGSIAAFEYRLALSLGAKVAVVQNSGGAASQVVADRDWAETPGFLSLPRDTMTLRAFVNPGRSELDADKLELMGRIVHGKYLSESKPSTTEASLLPWENLYEDFRKSSRQQAAYAEEILRWAGYGVRPVPEEQRDNIRLPDFPEHLVEAMAAMEHGRWNVERIQAGWRLGPKDTENKRNPYLVPWEDVPDEVRKYDLEAVQNFPKMFREAGLEVYRL